MTRQDFIKKWLVYGLVLVLTAGLQELVFSPFRPFGVAAVLLPFALTALASLEGSAGGGGFGIAVGVMSMYLDRSSPWIILAACVGGVLTGLFAQYVLSRTFMGYLVCSLGVLGLRMAYLVLPRWYEGAASLPVLLRLGGTELLWSMALSPIVYVLFRFAYNRWGKGYYV